MSTFFFYDFLSNLHKKMPFETAYDANSEFLTAIWHNEPMEVLEYILKKNPNSINDVTSFNGNNVLHVACIAPNVEAIEWLIHEKQFNKNQLGWHSTMTCEEYLIFRMKACSNSNELKNYNNIT